MNLWAKKIPDQLYYKLLKGFICPYDGNPITFGDCLDSCRRGVSDRCISRPTIQLLSHTRDWTGVPSTTQLLNGTEYASLEIVKDYYKSPDSMAFMMHGTSTHAKLEVDDRLTLMEEKLKSELGITGIPDVYTEENSVRTLIDYKTSGSYKVKKALGLVPHLEEHKTKVYARSGKRKDPQTDKQIEYEKGDPKLVRVFESKEEEKDCWDWELQLNLYRIMFEELGFPVDQMVIQAIVRDGGTWIAQKRGVKKNIVMISIKKIPDQKVIDYFITKRDRLLEVLKSEEYGKYPCNDRERWEGNRCNSEYCPVIEYCSKFGGLDEPELRGYSRGDQY